jgi:pentose-5-phosphate-3-epimerase
MTSLDSVQAGANILVAGTSVFRAPDAAVEIQQLREV